MRFIEIAAVACLALPLAGPAFAQGGGPAEGVRAATSGSGMSMRRGGMRNKMMMKRFSKKMMMRGGSTMGAKKGL